MSEHPLHRFDVRTAADGKRRSGMTEVVGRDPREGRVLGLRCAHRLREPAIPGRRQLDVPMPIAEQKLLRHFAGRLRGKRRRQKLGIRDRPRPVRLRRTHVHLEGDEHSVLLDLHPAPSRIDMADPQSGRLTPSQTRIREEEHQGGVSGLVSEELHLRVSEVVPSGCSRLRRQLDVAGDVAADPPVADGRIEDAGQDPVRAPDGGGTPGDTRHPDLHFRVPNAAERPTPPLRLDVLLPRRLQRSHRRRLQHAFPLLQPLTTEIADRHASVRRVDVFTARLGELQLGEPQFGVSLGLEASLRGLRVVRTPV
ncbi:hypothetical protein R8Z57_10690 [Microbacterium sp. M3]|uniref:Uncharacterized protein n=1 Tax=Microbacterium arthrosphaerae TaxID=792652 RepID=A0ABU4H1N5_9MICO|nr:MULTISPECIES: hypothetical protein [Microbacterium]MDW4573236.1 hypothetical protein [Microbacterium arthrosphaerae]MDW7607091.1 hypothetical protein [Microbacterium sp. M3]